MKTYSPRSTRRSATALGADVRTAGRLARQARINGNRVRRHTSQDW